MHETCPHCGKVSGEESPRFCSGCGARMDGTSPPGFPGMPSFSGERKNSTIAGFCSSVLPGLGQVYNGEMAKGFALFILALLGLFFLLVPGFLVWLYAMYDAHAVAGKMNTGEIKLRETRILHMVLFIVFAVLVIIVVLVIVSMIFMASLAAELGPTGAGSRNRLFSSSGSL
jgi:TM2 domain-containing membrane protein YozV